MIFIKDTTTLIVFNKNYNFEDTYVSGGNISARLTITNKFSKISTTYSDTITNDTTLRYFNFVVDLTSIDEGMYTYLLELERGSAFEEYEVGILLREIKQADSETYEYDSGTDEAFVYE